MIEGQEGVTWPQWLALARACEQSGIGTLYRSDHYIDLSGRHPERGSLDAWATLSALAAVTETIRLGTMVSPATFRHPSVLAKVAATADLISGGRIDVGLGAGWHEREHDAYGFPFPPTGERMEMLEEQLEIVVRTWSEDAVTFEGRHYALHDLDAQPRPVQKPHPPLILGGNAGPRSARLAARYADEYNIAFPTRAQIEERRSNIERACKQAGRDPIPFSVMTTVIVGDSEQDLEQRVRRVAERTGADAGTLINDPPETWILGTVERAAAQIQQLSDLGVSRLMCQHLAHEDTEFVHVLGEQLAPLVG